MPYNPTPPNFTPVALAALKVKILDILADIITMNNLDIALTKDERQHGVTVGPKREGFNDYYFENINNNAAFKPTLTTIPEADAFTHFGIHNGITEVSGLIMSAVEQMQDVQLNSEHFTFEHASQGRKYANDAVEIGKPGADSWADELNSRFPDTGPKGGDQNP